MKKNPTVKDNLIRQAKAIVEYQTYSSDSNPIPLCWWFNPAPGNFGDWLSPYVVTRLSGRSVKLIAPQEMKKFASKNLMVIGSIAKFANEQTCVLGAGVSRVLTLMNPKASYLMLRGPLTRDVLLESGGNIDSPRFGDPAIVMPRLYKCPRANNGRIALVRHFSHLNLDILLPENVDELSILQSSSNEIEQFIAKLHQYDCVITSAMHCCIICQAYGIPVALVTWEKVRNAVAGDGIKYLDYSRGVGLQDLSAQVLPTDLRGLDLKSYVSNESVPQEKIDGVYEYMKQVLSEF